MLKFYSLILLVSLCVRITAQDQSDFDLFLNVSVGESINDSYVEDIVDSCPSEFNIMLNSVYKIYKSFFSDQDGQHCSFHPSCSTYMLHSIKSNGLILGGIKGMDRLTRCNGFSVEKYEVDWNLMKLHDPIQ